MKTASRHSAQLFWTTTTGAPPAPAGHTELKPLNLKARELRQLQAFLRALSGGTTSPEAQSE